MPNKISIRTLAIKHYTNLTIKQCRLLGIAAGFAKSTGGSPKTMRALDRLMTSLVMSRKTTQTDRLAIVRYVLEHARDGDKKTQYAKDARAQALCIQLNADNALANFPELAL